MATICGRHRRERDIAGPLGDSGPQARAVIERRQVPGHAPVMMRFTIALLLAAAAALPAHAACYADYKAKRDNPLRLQYGVIELPDSACGSPASAEAEVRSRLAAGGWELLNVVGIFGEDGLEQRRDSAGEFFLRF
jgi:hypothetical protein